MLGFSKQTSTVRQFSATAQSPGPFENLSPKGNTVTSPFQKSHYGLETSRFSGVSIEQSKSNELNKLRKNEIIQEELDKIDHHDADDHDPYREEIQENTLNEEVQTDDSLTPTRTLQSEGTQTEEHPLPGGELTNLANQFNEGMDLIQQKRIPYTSRILNLSTDAKIQPTPRSVMPSRLSVVHRGFDTLGESVDFSGMSLKVSLAVLSSSRPHIVKENSRTDSKRSAFIVRFTIQKESKRISNRYCLS